MKYILIALLLFPLTSFASEITPQNVIQLVNEQRVSNHLNPVKIDGKLMIDSDSKSMDMADNSYFAHVSPVGKSLDDFLADFKKATKVYYCGENLSVGYKTSEDIVNAWMNSPTHKKVLLFSTFRKIGVASIDGKFNGKATHFTTLYMCY